MFWFSWNCTTLIHFATSFPSLWVWHSLWSESFWCRNALGCQYEAGRIHTSPGPRGTRLKPMVPCWDNQMWRAFPIFFVLPSSHPSWRFGIIRFGVLPSAQQFRHTKKYLCTWENSHINVLWQTNFPPKTTATARIQQPQRKEWSLIGSNGIHSQPPC